MLFRHGRVKLNIEGSSGTKYAALVNQVYPVAGGASESRGSRPRSIGCSVMQLQRPSSAAMRVARYLSGRREHG